ncbi:hypothetical protein GCM10011446_24400 [Acinetobacter vivianii]|nr:hypothetical protein GCM10011446_24400 [Acinetobacter vivianii]
MIAVMTTAVLMMTVVITIHVTTTVMTMVAIAVGTKTVNPFGQIFVLPFIAPSGAFFMGLKQYIEQIRYTNSNLYRSISIYSFEM